MLDSEDNTSSVQTRTDLHDQARELGACIAQRLRTARNAGMEEMLVQCHPSL